MTAMDFPNSPTVGQTYTVGTSVWVWTGTTWDGVLPGTKVQDTAPVGATQGDLWFNSAEARSYIYYDSTWVELTPGIAGPTGPSGAAGPAGEENFSSFLTMGA